MQDISSKQLNFVSRLVALNETLLSAIESMLDLKSEWDANAYAAGAQPTGNNLTDALLNGGNTPPANFVAPFPYLSQTAVNNLIGAWTSVQTTVAANRGYLEAARP